MDSCFPSKSVGASWGRRDKVEAEEIAKGGSWHGAGSPGCLSAGSWNMLDSSCLEHLLFVV
jgi:hypothetical protein